MKRIFAALLAALMVCSMAACQKTDTNSSSAPAGSSSAPAGSSSVPAAKTATIVKITIEGEMPISAVPASSSEAASAASSAPASSAVSSAPASSAVSSADASAAVSSAPVAAANSADASSAASSAVAVEIPEIPAEIPLVGEELTAEQIKTEMDALYAGTGKYADLPVATIETNEGIIKIRLFPEQAPKAVENFITHAKAGYYDGLTFHRVINDFMIQGGDPTGTGMGGESIWTDPFADEFSYLAHNFRGSLSMANAGYGTNGSQFFIVQNKQAFLNDEAKQDNLTQMFLNQEIAKGYGRLDRIADQITSEEQYNAVMDQLNAEIGVKAENALPQDFVDKMAPVMEMYEQLGGTPHLDYKHTVFGYVIEGMDVVDKIAQEYANG